MIPSYACSVYIGCATCKKCMSYTRTLLQCSIFDFAGVASELWKEPSWPSGVSWCLHECLWLAGSNHRQTQYVQRCPWRQECHRGPASQSWGRRFNVNGGQFDTDHAISSTEQYHTASRHLKHYLYIRRKETYYVCIQMENRLFVYLKEWKLLPVLQKEWKILPVYQKEGKISPVSQKEGSEVSELWISTHTVKYGEEGGFIAGV